MRVAVFTESFLPQINGVTNSVLRVLEHLESTGHTAMVAAPGKGGPESYAGARVRRLPALGMPGYRDVSVSLAGTRAMTKVLAEFEPDVIHLASPFVIGPPVIRAAQALDIPVVSVFQTDVAGFARHYGLGFAERAVWRRIRSIHSGSDRTLAPSTATIRDLHQHYVPRVHLWPRGVDGERFNPRHRSAQWRAQHSDGAQVIVGYVGRLAPEKQVDNLKSIYDLPGVKLVVVGDGPSRADLEKSMPEATFLGFLGGTDLSTAMASFDVMVHTGEHETFCQSVQEALACGVPVVAPGSGGPIDLVQPSRTGWLYAPGDLDDLRSRVRDLVGDHTKRIAMGEAARASVEGRTWDGICTALLGHYRSAMGRSTRYDLRGVDI